jgi:aminoglycoside phosphotransferase (APT) family kinase protein
MDPFNEMKQEILEELAKIFPNQVSYEIDSIQRFMGADTEIFGFRLITSKKKIYLVLRLFRNITGRAEREFETLKSLYDAGISVPKPYLARKNSQSVSRSYLIMEKVPGILLSDHFEQLTSEQEQIDLFNLYIQEMVHIHTFDWRSSFTTIESPDLIKDPYIYVDKLLSLPKELINQYDVLDLKPLVTWLEDNKVKSEQSDLLHGDFHMNNVLITPENSLKVIDWSNIRIGDFRHDLGFSIVATSSAGIDVKKAFTDLYETHSGRKVKNIEFFMILSILHNLLRIYSGLTNPQITNENETTKNMFLISYKSYTQYLVKIVFKVTGLRLPTIEKALN